MDFDTHNLVYRLSIGELTEKEIERLGERLKRDPKLAEELRDELQFSEFVRCALRDRSAEQDNALRDSLDHRDFSDDDWIQLLRDGDVTPQAADEMARRLLDHPEEAARLRLELMEEEWLHQAASPEKSEGAFLHSLVTRMWAEASEDQFVRDFTRRLDRIDREKEPIPFPGRDWKARSAVVAGLAAVVTVCAFVLTTIFHAPAASVAKIEKATADVVWADDLRPSPDGTLASGTYRLESGAVSLAVSDGKSLAIQGPAVFEVAESGDAVLHEGIALATMPGGKRKGDEKYGIGLSAKNLEFSRGAITVGLDARSKESTEAVIFAGDAGVCLNGESKKCRDVFEFEAIKADHSREKFVDIPYNPRAFSKAWELVSGVEKNVGDVVIELPGVDSGSRKSEGGELHVFVEKDLFQPDQPLEVDPIQRGKFSSAEEATTEKAFLAQGDPMRSYLLQLWPGDGAENREIEASVTFDHPVVGVIFSSDRLWESDKVVGVSTAHVADQSARGLDRADDRILLSEDGRTLNLRLKGSAAEIDQVRVLVALR